MSKQLQEICVERARGLKSELNVYFICRIRSKQSSESTTFEFRSTTISKTKNPEWKAKFFIDLTDDWVEKSSKKDGLELTLQIYGHRNRYLISLFTIRNIMVYLVFLQR